MVLTSMFKVAHIDDMVANANMPAIVLQLDSDLLAVTAMRLNYEVVLCTEFAQVRAHVRVALGVLVLHVEGRPIQGRPTYGILNEYVAHYVQW